MKKFITYDTLRKAFFLVALVLATINSFFLFKVTSKAAVKNKFQIYTVAGNEFADFKNKISTIEHVGYLTDKDMSPEKNNGQFLGAQYMLAPVILDLNNANHRYLILDYTNLFDAARKLRNIKAKVIEMTPDLEILAEKLP